MQCNLTTISKKTDSQSVDIQLHAGNQEKYLKFYVHAQILWAVE